MLWVKSGCRDLKGRFVPSRDCEREANFEVNFHIFALKVGSSGSLGPCVPLSDDSIAAGLGQPLPCPGEPKKKSNSLENVWKAVSEMADIRREEETGKVVKKVIIAAEI